MKCYFKIGQTTFDFDYSYFDMKKYCMIICLAILQSGLAQRDSITLHEIEIISTSIRHQSNKRNDSLILNFLPKTNLANQLFVSSELYLRNYGGSGLSLPSIRGGSSSQTLILWNDIPIHSPLLGNVDIGILNAGDQTSIIKGSESSMWGSGAVAGVINIKSNESTNSQLNFQNHLTLSSFNGIRNEISLKQSIAKTRLSFQYIHNEAENNFPVKLENKSYTNSNSAFNQNQYLANISFVDKKFRIDFKHWSLNHYREIPPLITQIRNDANQRDIGNRNLLNFEIYNKTSKLKLSNAYFDEEQYYVEPINKINGVYKYKSLISDLTYEYSENNLSYLAGGNIYHAIGNSSSIKEEIKDSRIASFAKIRFKPRYFLIEGSLRKEFYKTVDIPYIPSISFTFNYKRFNFKGIVNKAFRLPALNDLYWSPGGNINLKPESGWAQEIQLYILSNPSIEVNLYRRKINDWIQWGRKPNELQFSALNLTQVISKGIEFRFDYKVKISNVEIYNKVNYNFTSSENQVEIKIPILKKGQQLWYVPKHHLGVNTIITYKRFGIHYNHQFFSESTGINENVAPYNVANLFFKYKYEYLHNECEIYTAINNLGNKNFMVIERRPNPGINYQFGIILNINKT